MSDGDAAAAAAAALLAEAEATARGLLDTARSVAANLSENTAALSAIELTLVDQNAYLHRRVHDLATMITVLQGALSLLWDKSGFEAELGPLELHGLVPIDEPPVGE